MTTIIRGADYYFTGQEYEPTGLPPPPPPTEDDNPARLRPPSAERVRIIRERIEQLTALLRPLPKVEP